MDHFIAARQRNLGSTRTNKPHQARRLLIRFTASTILTLTLMGACLKSFGTTDTVEVYIYNASGVPIDESSTDSFTEGHIFDVTTNTDIGSVPNPTDGHIFDTNGNAIGFIAPSNAANLELP